MIVASSMLPASCNMRTTTQADCSSQLSEAFVKQLQLEGVTANNLAASNQLASNTGKDWRPEFCYPHATDEGDTLLHLAIIFGKIEDAATIIDRTSNPAYFDVMNDECLTALHYAAFAGESTIVRKLVLAGANTQLRTSQGDTALHLAVREGHIECVRALVQPLSYDEQKAFTESNSSLPRPCVHLDARNYVGISPLHIAASKNDVQLVHQLLLAGADVNVKEGLSGKSALHMAIEKDNAEVVHYLAQIPTTLLATTYSGEAAYQIACECSPHYIDALLRYGAAPVIRSHDEDSMSDDSSSSDSDYEATPYEQFSNSYSSATSTLVTV